ncbi:MAG: hypothetical protein KGI60_01090 [Patescibacteria group bacterium]|nr:hypothetical protein [Patescibacteria group bacterium]
MDQYLYRHQSQKNRRMRRIKIYLWTAGAFLLVVGLMYTVLDSSVFRIRSVTITGENYLTDADVLRILAPREFTSYLSLFLGQNNLLAWGNSRPDTTNTPLAEASVRRDWLRQSVSIAIQERNRFAIWCDAEDECAWIDRNGIPFQSAPQAEGSLIIAIHDISTGHIPLNSPVVEQRFVGNLIAIIDNLMTLNIPIENISYDPHLEEITVQSYGWPKILLSIRFDPTATISSLASLEQKVDITKLRYIDLRVENRIYYKS